MAGEQDEEDGVGGGQPAAIPPTLGAEEPDVYAPTLATEEPAAYAQTLLSDTGGEVRQRGPSGADIGSARYEPVAPLGRGGMGEVRLERDRRIGREVAIKRLHADIAQNASARARFLMEARVQAQLEHPAIVPVYDLADEGDPAFAMRRIRGRTLAEILESDPINQDDSRGRFGRRRMLSALSQVCLAVDYAHEQGFLHRDLKPANIMIGDFGEVYVLDWGLARRIEQSSEPALEGGGAPNDEVGESSASTRQGTVLGTPGYMSPEQLAGNIDALDRRSDVYGLGCILFEVLTHERLHAGDSLAEICGSIAAGAASRVRERSVAHELPPELVALCLSATETEADARLTSAGALSDAIEGYLDGDRDAALRREAADRHARRAEEMAQRAFEEGDLEERAEAGRAAVHALALAPEHTSARSTLVRVLTTPSASVPASLQHEFDETDREQRRLYFVGSIWILVGYLPIFAAYHVWRDSLGDPWSCVQGALWLLVAGLCFLGRRPERSSRALLLGVAGCMSLVIVSWVDAAGSLVVLPLLAALNLLVSAAFRGGGSYLGLLAVTLPTIPLAMCLDFSALDPSRTAMENGRLLITLGLGASSDAMNLAAVLVMSTLPPVASLVATDRMLRIARSAEQALHLQRWQLSQLLARDVSTSGASVSERPS